MNIDAEWIEDMLAEHRVRLQLAQELLHNIEKLTVKDQEFATNLLEALLNTRHLSPKQWYWIGTLAARIREAKPLYGDFKAIQVMFQIAGEHLKYPKIRLLSNDNVFVQLNFFPKTSEIKIFRGGWAGHGRRRFIGWVREDRIVPYTEGCITEDINAIIQELALDPQRCAAAMAKKLSACMYCGQRLSDEESKSKGYGPICAEHYQQPWGSYDPSYDPIAAFMEVH